MRDRPCMMCSSASHRSGQQFHSRCPHILWRDTRLSELPPSYPPTMSAPPPIPTTQASAQTSDLPGGFRFSYPTTFLLVPCFTDTTFAHLLGTVIPRARSSYRTQSPGHAPRASQAEIQADGLLLYVAQAIYEPGTSPLSSWVPLASPAADGASTETSSPLDVFERLVKRRVFVLEE
ncbi:hypothetical protein EDB86DRAFT_3101449 [Lactarius hatsudake]|nr:hypothetical protein EDB86DRAFT_3101449 [Lactarius hatsudake]